MEELWKDIKGYEGLYQISTFGRVRSLDRTVIHKNGHVRQYCGCIKKLCVDSTKQYWSVTLNKNGKKKSFNVHTIVARTFIPNPDNLPLVMHLDQKNLRNDGKCNNCVDNLAWGRNIDNMSQKVARQRLSKAHKGKILTQEWKDNVNKNRSGKKAVFSSGILFESIAECARFYSMNKETLRFWLNNPRLMPRYLSKVDTKYA